MPSLRRSQVPLLARTARSVAVTGLAVGLVAGALVGTPAGTGPRAAHAQAPTAPSPFATSSGLRFIVGPGSTVDAAAGGDTSLAERRAQLLDAAIGV